MNQERSTIHPCISALAPVATPQPDERWLYALMLLVPESIYGWLLYSTPALRTLPSVLLISALFVLHGALYLLAPRLPRWRWWQLRYAIIQATLIFAIVLVTSATPQPITLLLYASLAAQMVAIYQGALRPAIGVSALFLAIVVIDHLFFWGWSALVGFLLDVNDNVCAEVERFCATTGLACHHEWEAPPRLPLMLHETILRTVGEGLANIICHAQPQQVRVTLRLEAQGINLVVSDDGIGFDPAATRGSGHYGLIGLAERAYLAGGALDIASTPGVGTTLTLQLPLPMPAATDDQPGIGEQAHA